MLRLPKNPTFISSLCKSPLPLSLFHLLTTTTTNNNNNNKHDDDEWNNSWETAWLPDDLSGKSTPAPWESDVNFGLSDNNNHAAIEEAPLPTDVDPETKAFMADMNENWEERRKGALQKEREKNKEMAKGEDDDNCGGGLYRLENVKRDYRLKKQRIHAGLWMKEIDKLEEAKLGGGPGDDIEKLLDSCSEIFDSADNDLNNPKVPSTSEFKNKPDGWETTSKSEDGSVWDMSQREEDILLQEFERRMAFCKFQIASFIKTHIFSRRRPIDGWKYMIELIGPNAKQGKGSVSRLPGLADPATRPFTEERRPVGGGHSTSHRSR